MPYDMARIKAPPRVAQPDLDRQAYTPEAQAMSSAINEYQSQSNQTSNDENYHSTDRRILPKMPTVTGSEQPITEKRSAAAELVNIGHRLAFNNLTCPKCLFRFPDMGIKEFREHIESCARPVTGDSESATSTLSPPPESHHGDDGGDESTDPDHLTPYVAGEFTSYPETKGDAAGSGDMETADAQPRTNFPKLTDSQLFIDSLEDAEDLSYDVLFSRVKNASEALVKWQNEWMDLDRFIEVTEPVGGLNPAKPHKNPRIPKETQIGIGYRDELESFVYGFEYQYHQSKVGKQNPERQRYTNGSNRGRELRQRIPTQKAVEADLSTSPESDEGIGTRRRGRAQKLREGTADGDSAGGRGQRGRNTSRIDSQSRDQTPGSTFPSGKKRGRPAKAKAGGASRLQELQLEEGFEYDSTPEPSHDQSMPNYTENPGSMIRRRSYGFHETLETTERWHDDTEQDEPASRPGTSDSTMTGPSDDMRNPRVRSSGRGRKRQNTSDFEDALPSHKRIRKANNATANGFSDLDLVQSAKDANNAEKTRNTRRGRQEDGLPGGPASEDIFADYTSRSQDPGSKNDTVIQRNQSGKERKMVTLKTSNATSASAVLARSATTDPLIGTSAQQDGKDGPKISRASLNMRRRWAAKKQAEALGLPVPKIGRYPKGGSVPSTPDVAGDPDPSNSLKPLGGRKRKRDEEPNTANVGVSDAVAITAETPILIKKRGGRPRKVVNVEPPPNTEAAGEHMIHEGNRSNTSPSDKEDTSHEASVLTAVPKRKGGRPRKKPVEINKGTMGTGGPQSFQEGVEQVQQTSHDPNDSHSKVDEKIAAVQPENVRSANEEDLGNIANVEETVAAPQLRRTTRVRRQTSAALSASSQANTRRSSRSSQKSTVTPTPAPTQQPVEETVIKQETVAGPTLPRKRGRKPKSAVVDTTQEATVIATNVTEDEAPPAKRRRVARAAKVASTGSTPTPATASEEERTTPQEDLAVVQNPGSRTRKASIPYTPALEVLSDGQATSVEPSLLRKRARKPQITDTHATDAPSATPGSSVEPLVMKKKVGRPRKNVDAVTASGPVVDVSVKAEDAPRLPEPLTTRARGSGQDNAARVNSAEDITMGRQAIDLEPPKKKGNWGGKRTKGVFSSGNTPKTIFASRSDTNTGADDIEEHAQSSKLITPETTAQEAPRRGSLSGPRNKKILPGTSGEMGTDAAESAEPSDSPSRPKRVVSKAAAPIGEVGIQDAVPEMMFNILSRSKRAVTIAEAPARETNLDSVAAVTPSSGPPRPRRVVTSAVAFGGGMGTDDTGTGATSNGLSRLKRAAPVALSPEEDTGETGIDDGPSNASSRPKRVVTMKISPADSLATDNADASPDATMPTESIGADTNKGSEKKKSTWGGRRVKSAGAKPENVPTKAESDNEDSDSEATRKEKKQLAAKASKSWKNSQSMKARWANGSMHEVMRRKREANLAKKAAAAQAAENGEDVELIAEPASAPASAPTKRKAAPIKTAARGPKRRRTMNATMDGPADTDDEYDMPDASSSGPTSPIGRKVSEFERYQQLSSPLRSSHSRRKRRPAALRASQSFSKFTDDGDDIEMINDNEEDVESEIKKQFDSEYEHFRDRGFPMSNILPGKRKRKPVINLAEAMRIEAGDEDDFFME